MRVQKQVRSTEVHMSEKQPVFVSKAERNFLWEVIQNVVPRLAILGRDQFVGNPDLCEYWRAMIELTLQSEFEAEEKSAKANRKSDADRGIPAGLTFKKANEAKAKLERFRSQIETLRAEAKAAYDARQAARADGAATVTAVAQAG